MHLQRAALIGASVVGLYAVPAAAQSADPPPDGKAVYETACAACHGSDGRGLPRERVGFDVPLPDFNDCSFATPEPAEDWLAVMHRGGPARAFDRRMPAFGEALSEPELQAAHDYARTFCQSGSWPRGELNLPRPLVTEKAFPENEAVVTFVVGTGDERSVSQRYLYERRVGARSQWEVIVPFDMKEGGGGWSTGLGDVAVAAKTALYHSLPRGHIFSAGGEVVLPTGEESAGFGKGFTVLEPFLAFAQILPGNTFVQLHAGLEVPTDRTHADEAFWRATVGGSLTQGRFGRTWTPMLELLGGRELAGGERALWDVVPQMQITLSRRQHIMVNAGVRVPVNERAGRDWSVLTYFLWDWFDGGLFDGWR
jgi:mono/diheme cytochrome c family protein